MHFQMFMAYINWLTNLLAPGRCSYTLKLVIFKLISRMNMFLWNNPVNTTRPHWWQANISSRNGLMLSGNKLLPEPILTRQLTSCSVARLQVSYFLIPYGRHVIKLNITFLSLYLLWSDVIRDYSDYGLSQWEEGLLCKPSPIGRTHT